MILKLARKSLWNRRGTAILTLVSLAISVALILGINHLRLQAKESFTSTLSGTDLIVGARSGATNLLLYSVFHIGNATNNISWQSYEAIAGQRQVDWTIPISLGDSHRGFRVVGTDQNYFEHYRYGEARKLEFAGGAPFTGVFDTVLGAQVARELGYAIGDEIVIAHGLGDVSFSKHDDKPFTVTGILEPTGTPVDRSVHVKLEGIEAIHIDWRHGAKMPGRGVSAQEALLADLEPKAITAFLVGLKSRMATFTLQRQINDYRKEALTAILPGVALAELWDVLGMVENMLIVVAFLVLLATLVGMTTTLLSSMKERQRELAILRAVGAHAGYLFALIEIEALLLAFVGVVLGILLLWLSLLMLQPWLASHFGLFIAANPLNAEAFWICGGVLLLAALLALFPALIAYRRTLVDGLGVRL
ncbi:MAG: ABC transporter permease [Gammaproteobacteria bacterium]|jgi:putative ABC transport system permease protein